MPSVARAFQASVLRRFLVCGAVGWAAAIPAAAWVASFARPAAPASLLALLVYAIGSAVCHQLPERSFYLWGRQLPVCARCTGLYAGAAFAALLVWSSLRLRVSVPSVSSVSPRIPNPKSRITIVTLALLPNLLTIAYEWTTGVTPANWIRAAAGFVSGAVVASFLVYDVN
jgi:hypothetical protein